MHFNVRFNERRSTGRVKVLKMQRVGPVEHVAQVWEWVAVILKGSTPDVLGRLDSIKVEAEDSTSAETLKGQVGL